MRAWTGYGTCHWAGQALAGLGVVLTAQAVTGMLLGNAKAREGVSLSMIPAALLAALIPGAIIPLCMMETMRCNTTMKPAAILIAALIGVLSVGTPFSSTTARAGEQGMTTIRSLPLKNLRRKPARTWALLALVCFLAFSVFGGSLVVFSLQSV